MELNQTRSYLIGGISAIVHNESLHVGPQTSSLVVPPDTLPKLPGRAPFGYRHSKTDPKAFEKNPDTFPDLLYIRARILAGDTDSVIARTMGGRAPGAFPAWNAHNVTNIARYWGWRPYNTNARAPYSATSPLPDS